MKTAESIPKTIPSTRMETPSWEKDALVDQAWEDLKSLVKLPTVSDNPSPEQLDALKKMPSVLVQMFQAAGMASARVVQMPPDESGRPSNPLVYGKIVVDSRLPTILLYGHYDVVPAPGTWVEPDGQEASPFTPQEFPVDQGADSRLYGRGSADDKSGIIMHLSTLRAFKGKPPVNVILVLEGEEEIGTGSLDRFIKNNPGLFQADVLVIADTGNAALGVPSLTTSLRGLVACDVTVKTLDHAEHSGMFGGPAPDAFMALIRLLDTLLDGKGDVAVKGLKRYTRQEWPPSSPQEEETFRNQAGVLPGVQLTGTGSITQRLAGSPSICVVGLDGIPSIESSINQLHPSVTARISARLAPDQDPSEAYEALRSHLLANAPLGAHVEVSPIKSSGEGYCIVGDGGRYFADAKKAIAGAYPGPKTCAETGLGGTIPMINVIAGVQDPSKDPTVVMWGCEEPTCRIHGGPESVSRNELQAMIRAEINLFNCVAARISA